MKEKMKEWAKCCFEGELTVKKTTLWMIGLICLLGGIVYGLKTAPLTHGINIGSNNGNCLGQKKEVDEDEEVEEEDEEE
ncbi:MAG: hypothetical protein NC541_11370 [bacterium]|nr:hypothetical protein [bacterium]